MSDDPKVPPEGGETPKETPKPTKEATPELPEKFKDKSAAEIAKAYAEAEKKLGEMSAEVGKIKGYEETLGQWNQLGEIIKGNPALLKAIEEEVKAKTAPKTETKKDDVRTSIENRTINEFEQNWGIASLPAEEKQKMHQKIGAELKDMLDPDGTKTTQQIIAEIPLDRLPRYLEKAYKLATIDDTKEKSRLEGLISERQNKEGAFGSIPSSGSKSDSVSLTEEQRNVAKKLGIPEEKYLKQLKKTLAE